MQFTMIPEPHILVVECRRCGDEMIFSDSARPDEIEREKRAHVCALANAAA